MNSWRERVEGDDDDRFDAMRIDWARFWKSNTDAGDWLAEPVIAAGRATALYAPAGVGKSLLALWIAVKLSTGRHPFARHSVEPVRVLYVDYEMTEDDLRERLEKMGVTEADDLSCLHYFQMPPIAKLDTEAGGLTMAAMAAHYGVGLVVIDTISRAVDGEENDADTYRDFYDCTGRRLKADGRALVRVDHAGKDPTKGQRGSSAKNDDVDVIWQMERKQDAFTLKARKRRVGWVPERVNLTFEGDERIVFALTDADAYPDGTVEMANLLDELGADASITNKSAGRLLRDSGHKGTNTVIAAALRYRRERSTTFHLDGDRRYRSERRSERPRNQDDETATNPQVNGGDVPFGTGVVPINGTTTPNVPGTPTDDPPDGVFT